MPSAVSLTDAWTETDDFCSMAANDERDPLTTVTKPLPSASLPLSTARGDTRKKKPRGPVDGYGPLTRSPPSRRLTAALEGPKASHDGLTAQYDGHDLLTTGTNPPHRRTAAPDGPKASHDGLTARYDGHDPLTRSRIPSRRPHGRYGGPKTSHYGRTAAYDDHNSRQSRFPAVDLTAALDGPPKPLEPKTVIFFDQKRESARLPVGSVTGPPRPSGRKRL